MPRTQTLIASGTREITRYAFSPKENYLAIGFDDNSVDLYENDAHQWKAITNFTFSSQITKNNISTIIFLDDERILTVAIGRSLYFRPLKKGLYFQQDLEHSCGEVLNVMLKNNLLMIIGKKKVAYYENKNGCFTGNNYPSIDYNNGTDYNDAIKCVLADKNFMIIKGTHVYLIQYPAFQNKSSSAQTITFDGEILDCAFSPCEEYCIFILKITLFDLNNIKIFKRTLDNKLEIWTDISSTALRQQANQKIEIFLFVIPNKMWEPVPMRIIDSSRRSV